MNDVSCVDHFLEFCPKYHKVQIVTPGLPVGAKLHQFYQKWAALGASPKVITVLKEGFILPKSDKVTQHHKLLCQSHRKLYLSAVLHQLMTKNAVELVTTQTSSRVLQQAIPSSQTQQLVETYIRPQYPQQIFKDRGSGLPRIHGFQRCILPHTDSKSVQEVHAISHPGSVLPIQITAI